MPDLKQILCEPLSPLAIVTLFCLLTSPSLAQSITVNAGESRAETVFSSVANAVISNRGSIATAGDASRGIFSRGLMAETVNAVGATVATSGNAAHAIASSASNALMINRGSISTEGRAAHGFFSTGDMAEVINAAGATLATTADFSRGMLTTGADTVHINRGTIAMQGDSARAISSTAANAVITNYGTITMTGGSAAENQASVGISSGGIMAEIVNAAGATLTLTGAESLGILAAGARAVVTSHGTISMTGARSHAIFASGDGAEVTIGGQVFVTGEQSYVVKGSDAGNQTLNLLSGAQTRGSFNLGDSAGDNDIANIGVDDIASSATFTIGGAERINLLSDEPNARILRLPRLANNAGDTVAVLDPTGSSATRMALGATTGQIPGSCFSAWQSPQNPRQIAMPGPLCSVPALSVMTTVWPWPGTIVCMAQSAALIAAMAATTGLGCLPGLAAARSPPTSLPSKTQPLRCLPGPMAKRRWAG